MNPLHSEDAGQPSDLKSVDDESDEEAIDYSEEEGEESQEMDCNQSFDSKAHTKDESLEKVEEGNDPMSQNGSTSSETLGLYSSFDNIVTSCYEGKNADEKPYCDSPDATKLDDHDISAHLKGTLSFGLPSRGNPRISLPYRLKKKRGKTSNFFRPKRSQFGLGAHVLKLTNAAAERAQLVNKVEKTIEMDKIDHLSGELQIAYRIVRDLMSDSLKTFNSIFMETIELDAKINGDYLEVVKTPIWLPKIKENLLAGEYKTITEVVYRLRLMFENAYRYFGSTHSFSRRGLRMEFILEQKLNSLPSEIKKLCTLAATHGVSEDIKNEFGSARGPRIKSSTITVNGEKFFSYLLHNVRGCRPAREKEMKLKRMHQMRSAKIFKEVEIIKWEERLTGGPLGGPLRNMWELVQVNQFLFLTSKVLNIYKITQYEMERMLMLPEASMTLRMLMTSLVLSRQQRAKFTEKPYMPYGIWAQRLASKTLHWYRVYTREKKNPEKVFDQLGIEPKFWSVCGQKNPFEKSLFHELTLYQRIWLLKSLCDYIAHSHKSVQECIAEQPEESLRERLLGRDSSGFEYFHFPQFANSDVRVYRRSKMVVTYKENGTDLSEEGDRRRHQDGKKVFSNDQIKRFRKLIKKIKKNHDRDSDWEEEQRKSRSIRGTSTPKKKKRGRPHSFGSATSTATTPERTRTRPERLRQTPKPRYDLYSSPTFSEEDEEEKGTVSWTPGRRRQRESSGEGNDEGEETDEGEEELPRAKVKNRRKNSVPIACKTCGKTFAAKSAMYGHMAMHVRKKDKVKSSELEEKNEEMDSMENVTEEKEMNLSQSSEGNFEEESPIKKENEDVKEENNLENSDELNEEKVISSSRSSEANLIKKTKILLKKENDIKEELKSEIDDKEELKKYENYVKDELMDSKESDVESNDAELKEKSQSDNIKGKTKIKDSSEDQTKDSENNSRQGEQKASMKEGSSCVEVTECESKCVDKCSDVEVDRCIEMEDVQSNLAKETNGVDEGDEKDNEITQEDTKCNDAMEEKEDIMDAAKQFEAPIENGEVGGEKLREDCDKSVENKALSDCKNTKGCNENATNDDDAKSVQASWSNLPSEDSASIGTASVAEPETGLEPTQGAEPADSKEFELVAASFSELRNLILRFGVLPLKCAKEKKTVEEASEESQEAKEGAKDEEHGETEEEEGEEDKCSSDVSEVPKCEQKLHRRLCKYLVQLSPSESKINLLHKQNRKKLYNEYKQFLKRDPKYVDPAEDAWVSDPEPDPIPSATQTPKQSSSSSSSEEEFNEDGSRKRKLRKRRVKRVTNFEQPSSPTVETTANIPSPSLPSAAEGRLAVSSRGRVRKVKRLVNYDRLDFDKLAEYAEKDALVQKAKKRKRKEEEGEEEEGREKKLQEVANRMHIPASGVRRYILSKAGEVVGYVGNDGRVHSGLVKNAPKKVASQTPPNETPSQKTKEIDHMPKIVVSAMNDAGMPVYVRMVGAQALELVKLIEATKGQPARQVKLQRFMQTYTFNTNSQIMTQNIPGYPDSDTSNPHLLSQKSNIPQRGTAQPKPEELTPFKVTPKKTDASPVPTLPVTCRSPNPVALAYQGLPSSTTSTRFMSLPSPSNSLDCPVSSTVDVHNSAHVSVNHPTLPSTSCATLSASTRLVFASPSTVPSVRPITVSSSTEQIAQPASSTEKVPRPTSVSSTSVGTPALVQTDNGQQLQISLGSDRLSQIAQRTGQRVVAVPNDKGGYTLSLVSTLGAQQVGRNVAKTSPGPVAVKANPQKSVITQFVPAVANTSSGAASTCLNKDSIIQQEQMSVVGAPHIQPQQQVMQQVVSGSSAVGRQVPVVIQHTPTSMVQQHQQQVVHIAQGNVGQQQFVQVQPQAAPKVLQLVQTAGGRQLLQVLQPGQVLLGSPSNTSPQGGVVVHTGTSQGIQCAKQPVASQHLLDLIQHAQQQQPSKIIQVAQPEQFLQRQTHPLQFQGEQVQSVVQPQQHYIVQQQEHQPTLISSSMKPTYTHTPSTSNTGVMQQQSSQPQSVDAQPQSYVAVTQSRKVLHQTPIQPQQTQIQQPAEPIQQQIQQRPVQTPVVHIQRQSQQLEQQTVQIQQPMQRQSQQPVRQTIQIHQPQVQQSIQIHQQQPQVQQTVQKQQPQLQGQQTVQIQQPQGQQTVQIQQPQVQQTVQIQQPQVQQTVQIHQPQGQQTVQIQQPQGQQTVQIQQPQQTLQIQQTKQTVQVQQQSQQQQPKENARQQMGRLVLLQMSDGQKVYLQLADGRYSVLPSEQLQPLISSGAIKFGS